MNKPVLLRFILIALVLMVFRKNDVCSQNQVSHGKLEVNFSHSRKLCNEPFHLELTTNEKPATIYYTLDCSTPGPQNGLVYAESILIESGSVVKAVAYSTSDTSVVVTHSFIFPASVAKQGKTPAGFPVIWGGSSIIKADYEMDPLIVENPKHAPEIPDALLSIPSVSLSMKVNDWFDPVTGVYKGYPNSSVSVEKAVTAEFLFNDSAKSFAVQCGVQNQGGTSIVNWKVPKQSMRLLFKEIYGPAKLKYKLFPDSNIKSINTLVLDGLLYSWVHSFDEKQRQTSLYFRDQLASDMQNKMGWPSFHGIYVNLFINGLYWGIYDLHERPDEDFMAEYLDADKEEFDVIKHNPNTIVAGSNSAYLEMLELARKGLNTPGALKEIQKYLDLPAFIDYMILNFYLGNFDWAHQNYYAARNWVRQSGFRFYTWDAEHVMRYSDVNYNNIQKNDKGGPTEIHSFLKQNKEYQMMFADAVFNHFFNNGALTPQSFEESFLFRKNEIEKAIVLESARWGDYRKDMSGITYTKEEHWVPEVNKVLEQYIPRRRDIVVSQLRGDNPKLFPAYMPPVIVYDDKNNGVSIMLELINPNTTEGDMYYTLDGSDPRATGGFVKGLKYSKPVVVEGSSIVKTRFLPKGSSEWSALAKKIIVFDEVFGKGLVINEIMYHPEQGFPEFVELFNSGVTSINISGFRFSKGIDYVFDNFIMPPGTGLVLTNDTALFKNVYGFSAFGEYSKKLDNKGEVLILKNQFDQIVDSVNYSDTIPWPLNADGQGSSLELINPKADNSVFSNWKASEKRAGTPLEHRLRLISEATLYPNPFNDFFSIEIGEQEEDYQLFVVDVFNLFGSKIKSFEKVSENFKIQIPAHDLSSGMYVIQIKSNQNSNFKKRSFKALKL